MDEELGQGNQTLPTTLRVLTGAGMRRRMLMPTYDYPLSLMTPFPFTLSALTSPVMYYSKVFGVSERLWAASGVNLGYGCCTFVRLVTGLMYS